jgi:hypothetical protein
MIKIIVNAPTGQQEEIKIDESGSYFDSALIVWDERKDKPLHDNYTLGKLVRVGNEVTEQADFIESHAAIILANEEKAQYETKKEAIAQSIDADVDLESLRKMSDAEIDDWFSKNVTSEGPIENMLKKVVKALIKNNIL